MKKYLYQIKGLILLSILLFGVETLITSTLLYLPGRMIDAYVTKDNDISSLILMYIGLFSLYLISCYGSNRLADYRRIRFEKNIKKDFFAAVLHREYKDFKDYEVGEYISMQSNDITEMCQNYLSPFVSLFRSAIMIIIFGIYMLVLVDASITAVIIACSIITVFTPLITAERLAKSNHIYLERLGKYVTKTTAFFDAHAIFDCKTKKKLEEENDKELEDVYHKFMEFRRVNSLAYVINGGSVEFVSVVTFIMVAALLFGDHISVGMATTAFMYSTKFTEPIYELNVNIGSIKSVKKIQMKLTAILNKKPSTDREIIQACDIIQLSGVKKGFAKTQVLLPDMQLVKGHKYMIIGPNGIGKSVMLRLLMQHEVADGGTISYDGTAISHLDLDELVGYLPQNTLLFNTDYLNNVTLYGTYSGENLPLYESYFPEKIIAKIKDNPSLINLSGGEKQVVAIIRSLCMDKAVLLWDEPFSAMNSACIDYFMSQIHRIPQLIVIVAHNLNDHMDSFDQVYTVTAAEKELISQEA